MVTRRKIGLIYSYDENWIGGAYYIQNLVIAFKKLDDPQRPFIVLFSELPQYEKFKAATGYPYIMHSSEYQPPFTLLDRAINKLSRLILKRPVIDKKKFVLDAIFPLFDEGGRIHARTVNLYWIPDFQEHYLPAFFSQEEIDRRITIQKGISGLKGAKLLLSSRSAFDDYKKFYPDAHTSTYVVPFAVSHPPFEEIDLQSVRNKYHVPVKYFISANQFWAHKNHLVILEAVKLLKSEGTEICVVFTGRQHDWRNPAYFAQLEKYVQENCISDNILFLGLIDRLDQLLLLKNAEAIIQPSRFEGWSTVIEDAKAMDQFVVASNLPVHLEQLEKNGVFFNPDNARELADHLKSIHLKRPAVVAGNYSESVVGYARTFLKIFEN
jgi:glycosyltransferase involved in cell wall biosynthesis